MPNEEQLELAADRGSVTLFVAIVAAALFAAVSLVYDGALMLGAARQASSIASESARAAAQEVNAQVVIGGAPTIDPARAQAAANAYLSQVGATGTVNVTGQEIVVTVQQTWDPVFTGLFDSSPRVVSGTATVSTVSTLGGQG